MNDVKPLSVQDHPIVWAEIHHQRWIIARGRVGWGWIILAAGLVVPSLSASVGWVVILLMSGILPSLLSYLPPLDHPLAILLLTMTIAMYAVVTLIGVALASNSIQREKTGQTWDVLRLTHMGAEALVWGKWRACLRAIAGDHVMVSVVRMGFLAFLVGVALPALLVQRGQSFPFVEGLWWVMLVLVGLTGLYSVLDAALTAALGIASAVPSPTVAAFTGMAALAVRLVLSLAAGAYTLLSLDALFNQGVGALVVLSLLGVGLYAGLISLTLWVAVWLLRV